jgi:hypothetical protein
LCWRALQAQGNFWTFLTKYYGKEIWLVAPKHYTNKKLK